MEKKWILGLFWEKNEEKMGFGVILGRKKFKKWVLGLFWEKKVGKNEFWGCSGERKKEKNWVLGLFWGGK